MKKYSKYTIDNIRKLRATGLTYSEINLQIGSEIPKNTFSYLCNGVILSNKYSDRLKSKNLEQLKINRVLAVKKNKDIFNQKLEIIRNDTRFVADLIQNPLAAKVALAMLYLGEGSKWKGHRGLMLGSSDSRILITYMELLRRCYGVPQDNFRCRIQYRADQNLEQLVKYWSGITKVEVEHFYPSYFDKRTIGKQTLKDDYMGVCVVSCAGAHVQLELDIIADIIGDACGALAQR